MAGYEDLGLLHKMFTKQAKLTPTKTAIVTADGDTMTYKELDDITDVLATNLKIKGVVPNTVVGIYMERCLEYPICYIAILKAGGAYMPLDPSYPQNLLSDILSDSKPVAICAAPSLQQYVKDKTNVIVFNEGWKERIAKENSEQSVPESSNPTLDSLAYTVYSSGTTGKPKGIQCPHRGAVFSYHFRHLAYPYAEDEREACNVFFVWEMLRPLLKGVTLYIIPDNVIYDPRLLCEFIKTNSITRMLYTPSLLEAVLDADNIDVAAAFKSMRMILFCGEVVTTVLMDRCMKIAPWVQYVNLYSVSEAHDITAGDLTEWYNVRKGNIRDIKFCPVGRLIPGVSVVIMDENLDPQPVGQPGEIYIGGPTLAVGYLNRPELNETRFIRRPGGTRLYKAGDWGYMLSDGSLEICGRCDSMVKIRGYSIEVQAVEAALIELSMVNTCVVITIGAEGEDKHLVAYVVPEGKTTKKEVRAALKRRLPFYMIPSHFVFLASIPLLASSGKLNKKALPPIDKEENEVEEGMPTTETEKKLAPLWADALQVSSVDVQESFFDLGGHSLLATKLLSKVNEVFGVELAVRDLFTHSTISAMAKHLDVQLNKSSPTDSSPTTPALDLNMEVERHDQGGVLSLDIQLRAFWRSMTYTQKWNSGRVLLTGATGYLGAFLLRDLLIKTKVNIYCLVRRLPDQSGIDRVKANLAEYGILADSRSKPTEEQALLMAQIESRVWVVTGDVGLRNMGLKEDEYTYLCTEIDFIIHAAAYVNLVYPYQALHGPNVLGTENVLVFAWSSKIKPVHYISTDAVFPHGQKGCGEDSDMSQYPTQLDDGYSQSKWVAEQLVLRAMSRGLPIAIYRLGNLAGERKHGYWNPQDFTLLMLQGCLASGLAPDVQWDLEMTPVDFVSDFIVTLTQNMQQGLSKVFHLMNCKPMRAVWLFEWLCAHGYPLKTVPYEEWIDAVKGCNSANSQAVALLLRLHESMIKNKDFFSNLSTYTNEQTLQVYKSLNLEYPQTNSEALASYFHNLSLRKVIPSPRKNTILDQPLQGQVAIVTGSSSGIGAAIARRLAKAGAMVAMAARREDKLKDVKTAIENEGGVAIAVKCDVTDRTSVAEMVSHTEATLGPIDILVNNAGVMYYTYMKNLKQDEWNTQVDINCKGVLNCIGASLDGMLKRGKGHIVNMSSDAARRGFAGLAVYSGTKFFVEGLSQGMRVELADTGVKVTCIQPGDVKTELLSHTVDNEAQEAFDGSSSNKILEPDDIGRAVLYAVSQPSYCAVNEILIEPRTAPI